VIVVTGEDSGESDFILSVMQVGGMELTGYIQKPADGDKLDRAIPAILAKAASGQLPEELRPFSGSERRRLLIFRDKILLCGAQVWTDCAYPEMGKVIRWLAERGPNGYLRIRGSELSRRLERNASNQIGQPIKRFRESCREKMASCLDLDCGLYDVIGNTKGGGYHLTESIDAVVFEDEASPVIGAATGPMPQVEPPSECMHLNERQRWILDQIASGGQVSQKTVIEHFRRALGPSTVKRDLKDLRERGLIVTDEQGQLMRR
jgi:DNA-binding transcriptional ArsR family regulator